MRLSEHDGQRNRTRGEKNAKDDLAQGRAPLNCKQVAVIRVQTNEDWIGDCRPKNDEKREVDAASATEKCQQPAGVAGVPWREIRPRVDTQITERRRW